MMHKFCPSCGSLDMKRLISGTEECVRCKFRGEFREGSMDEIDAFRKSKRPAAAAVSNPNAGQSTNPNAPRTTNALKEKLAAMKGRKTDDFEII